MMRSVYKPEEHNSSISRGMDDTSLRQKGRGRRDISSGRDFGKGDVSLTKVGGECWYTSLSYAGWEDSTV